MHLGWLLHNISLYLQKKSIFGIKSASLRKISVFAVNGLLFYLFELHIFPSPTYIFTWITLQNVKESKDISEMCKNVMLKRVCS